jgi:hypothetical protein
LIVEFGKRAEEVKDVDTDESEMTLINPNDSSAIASDEDTDLIENEPLKASLLRRQTSSTVRRASVASFHHWKIPVQETDVETARLTEQKKEHSEQGKVKWDVYLEYAKACSFMGIALHFIFVIGAQSAQVGISSSDYIDSRWKSLAKALVRSQ